MNEHRQRAYLHHPRLIAFSALAVTVVLVSCTLAGEPIPAGPVEERTAEELAVPTFTPAPTIEMPPDIGYPLEVPDATEGAAIFAARCAACHGPGGSAVGGEMTQTLIDQGFSVPDFTDATLVRQKSPAAYFEVITNGNLDALMPPWGQELTESERWSLAFYLFTLVTSPESLGIGQVAYEARCAACHGQSGLGDGPEASGPLPDLSDPIAAIERSPQVIFDVISSGEGTMPGFAEELSEEERWAVVDYAVSLAYLLPEFTAPAIDIASASVTGTVRGQVVNATTNAPVAEGQEVFLHGLLVTETGVQEVISLQTATDGRGNYVFEGVPFDREELIYVADVAFNDVAFNSAGRVLPGEMTELNLPIQVFDTTQDPSVVSVDTLHVVVSPQASDSVLVAQIYVFSNSSNQVYVSDQFISETRRATVRLPVPPEAVSLAFEDGELGGRFVASADSVFDSAAVLPGPQSHSIVMTYIVPYDGNHTLSIPLYYRTEQVSVLFEDTGMRVQAEALETTETDDPNLEQFQILSGQGFDSGEEIVISLRGAPGSITAPGNIGLLLAGGIAIAALAGAGVWWWRRGSSGDKGAQRAATTSTRDRQRALMQAIADLDDAYEAGQVLKADYEARRARLKAELVALMEAGQS